MTQPIRLPIGKYSGWLVDEVAQFSPQYLRWLADFATHKHYPALSRYIGELTEGLPFIDAFILHPVDEREVPKALPQDGLLYLVDTFGIFVRTRDRYYRLHKPTMVRVVALQRFLAHYPSEPSDAYHWSEHHEGAQTALRQRAENTPQKKRRKRLAAKASWLEIRLSRPLSPKRRQYEAATAEARRKQAARQAAKRPARRGAKKA